MNQPLSVQTIRNIPLFHNLNETECRQVSEVLQMMSFHAGDPVIRRGEDARNLWIVLQGQCEVSKRLKPHDTDDARVVLAVLDPPAHFGEMSFFHPAPHSADVTARTDVTLLRITHKDYQDMIAEGVWAAYKLAYNVVEGLAERMRRMDEWVTDLLAHHQSSSEQVPEWSEFRERLFNRWNG